MSATMQEIHAYLQSLNWRGDEFSGMVSPHYEYRVNLEGDYGFAWELQCFDDSDRDGIATARWVRMNVDGDTLEELKTAMEAARIIA